MENGQKGNGSFKPVERQDTGHVQEVVRQAQNVGYVLDLADQARTDHTDFETSHRILSGLRMLTPP